MNASPVTTRAYETQYFGFHPCAFTDVVYNALLKNSHEALSALQAHLLEEFGHVSSEETIRHGTEMVLQKYVNKLDKGFDKLEVFLDRNVLVIPEHIVLPEDKIHVEKPTTESDDCQLDSDIKELEQKIIQAKKDRAYLKMKLQEQRFLIELLRSQRQRLEKITNIKTKIGLEESIAFSISRASELCDLLQ